MYRHNLSTTGWALFVLLVSNCVLMTIAYPQTAQQIPLQYRPSVPQQYSSQQLTQQQVQAGGPVPYTEQSYAQARKYSEKSSPHNKIALDDIDDDTQTNQIQESGFSWSNMITTFLQMFFNGGGINAPTKSDDIDNNASFATSPWANVISVGLKIITTLLGGGAPSDGIDKVDNGGNGPIQGVIAAVLSTVLGTKDPEQVNTMAKQAGEFFNIVINLLDALKTSFSHRSLAARSIGKRDSVSDAAVAGISMLKSYVKTYKNGDDKCMQKYMCEANNECIAEIGGSSIFCQLGTYATSFMLERTTGNTFENFYDAGRRGRSGENCRQIYLECNEV